MPTPLVSPKFYAWDPDTGAPLAFGRVYAFEPDSTNPKPTYQDEAGEIENAHPVQLNAAGFASIYLSGAYRIVLTDENDVTIWEQDPVSDFGNDIEEWVSSVNAEYLTPTSFRVTGDMTDVFVSGRALKITDAQEIIGHVDQSSYSGGYTTVSIYGSHTITAAMTKVSVGLISVAPLAILNTGIAIAGGRSSGGGRGSAIYAFDDILGGTPDHLDGLDGLSGGPTVNGVATPLMTGDIAFVGDEDSSLVAMYIMDDDSGESSDGDKIVAPVSNPGLKRWKKKSVYMDPDMVLDTVYPVGRIISTYTGVNPGEPTSSGGLGYPGTWELWGVGRVSVCVDENDEDFNAAGLTGGDKAVTLTAAQSGLQAHTHGCGDNDVTHTHSGTTSTNGEHSHSYSRQSSSGSGAGLEDEQNQSALTSDTTGPAGDHFHSFTTSGASTSHRHQIAENDALNAEEAHQNMPPFITEYRWRRTA